VKGNLMPTRALGDLRLKLSEFNFHSFAPDLGYRQPIPKYNGPYITHVPEIEVIDLTKEDQYLVLASDGLWDEISRKKSAELVKGNDNELKKVAAW
jgi:pyruvate dehydrogenase phosphatase